VRYYHMHLQRDQRGHIVGLTQKWDDLRKITPVTTSTTLVAQHIQAIMKERTRS
jgi:hypothetical protein